LNTTKLKIEKDVFYERNEFIDKAKQLILIIFIFEFLNVNKMNGKHIVS